MYIQSRCYGAIIEHQFLYCQGENDAGGRFTAENAEGAEKEKKMGDRGWRTGEVHGSWLVGEHGVYRRERGGRRERKNMGNGRNVEAHSSAPACHSGGSRNPGTFVLSSVPKFPLL